MHDIGKNLVDIILSNNGYTVVNIGIKQPINAILEAADEHDADAIGMSGLLVKSTVIMKENLEEMNARGLAERYPGDARWRGADPRLRRAGPVRDLRGRRPLRAGRVRGPAADGRADGHAARGMSRRPRTDRTDTASLGRGDPQARRAQGPPAAVAQDRRGPAPRRGAEPVAELPARSDVATDNPDPRLPPFWGDRVVKGIALADYAALLDERATFMGQWGLRGARGGKGPSRTTSSSRPRDVRGCGTGSTGSRPKGSWKQRSSTATSTVSARATTSSSSTCDGTRSAPGSPFPRQRRERRLCLADFFRAEDSGELDVVAFTVVTVGEKISEFTHQLFEANAYRDYLEAHGLSVQLTEALAEYWHRRIREELVLAGRGRPPQPRTRPTSRTTSSWATGARGTRSATARARISRTAPRSCSLLRPERIGVELSEEFQLHPEQSTDAIVVHHPEAKYFNT